MCTKFCGVGNLSLALVCFLVTQKGNKIVATDSLIATPSLSRSGGNTVNTLKEAQGPTLSAEISIRGRSERQTGGISGRLEYIYACF